LSNLSRGSGFRAFEDVFDLIIQGGVAGRTKVFNVQGTMPAVEAARIAETGGLERLAADLRQLAGYGDGGEVKTTGLYDLLRLQLSDDRILKTLRDAGYTAVNDPGNATSLESARQALGMAEIAMASRVTPVDVGSARVEPGRRRAAAVETKTLAAASRAEPAARPTRPATAAWSGPQTRVPISRTSGRSASRFSVGGGTDLEIGGDAAAAEALAAVFRQAASRARSPENKARMAAFARQAARLHAEIRDPGDFPVVNLAVPKTPRDAEKFFLKILEKYNGGADHRTMETTPDFPAAAEGHIFMPADTYGTSGETNSNNKDMTYRGKDQAAPEGAVVLYLPKSDYLRMEAAGEWETSPFAVYDSKESVWYITEKHPRFEQLVAAYGEGNDSARQRWAAENNLRAAALDLLSADSSYIPPEHRVQLPQISREVAKEVGAIRDKGIRAWYIDGRRPDAEAIVQKYVPPEAQEILEKAEQGLMGKRAAAAIAAGLGGIAVTGAAAKEAGGQIIDTAAAEKGLTDAANIVQANLSAGVGEKALESGGAALDAGAEGIGGMVDAVKDGAASVYNGAEVTGGKLADAAVTAGQGLAEGARTTGQGLSDAAQAGVDAATSGATGFLAHTKDMLEAAGVAVEHVKTAAEVALPGLAVAASSIPASMAIGGGAGVAAVGGVMLAKRLERNNRWAEWAKASPHTMETKAFSTVAGRIYKLERSKTDDGKHRVEIRDKTSAGDGKPLFAFEADHRVPARTALEALHGNLVDAARRDGAEIPKDVEAGLTAARTRIALEARLRLDPEFRKRVPVMETPEGTTAQEALEYKRQLRSLPEDVRGAVPVKTASALAAATTQQEKAALGRGVQLSAGVVAETRTKTSQNTKSSGIER
jgi:hypothetical protein